jgi:hypothetical protein
MSARRAVKDTARTMMNAGVSALAAASSVPVLAGLPLSEVSVVGAGGSALAAEGAAAATAGCVSETENE